MRRPRDEDAGDAGGGAPTVSLLRDSFAGVNARFHLVGVYTLVDLLLRISVTVLGEDPDWFGLYMMLMVVASGVVFGIHGVVWHAAAGREGKPSFARYATVLFFPLIWLQIRLAFLVYVPAFVLLISVHGVAAPAVDLQQWLETPRFLFDPIATLIILALSLYAMPLCILDRERGRRGRAIREGLRLMRDRAAESRRLLALIAVIAALGGIMHYLRGPGSTDLVPSIPEGLLLFATSYLYLIAFFGATRVVIEAPIGSAPPRPPGAPPSGPAAT